MTELSQSETYSTTRRLAKRQVNDRRELLISMNPRAGWRTRHDLVDAIITALRSGGYQVRITTSLDELKDLVRAGLEANSLRAVIAIGGDGTASVVRNHVPLEVPMLVVPMGTENLLGRYLRQLAEPHAVFDVIEHGVVIDLDLGRANGKHFLLMISAGFDAEVIRSLHENRRGNISRLAYCLPLLRVMRSYKYPQMQLHRDTRSAPGGEPFSCRWLFGFNLPLYALGLPIAPDAVATDGLLDVCTFKRGAVWGVARYLWHVARRMHVTLSDARLCQMPRFRLEAPGTDAVAYQLDGDYAGTLPVAVDVLPGQLRLLVSASTASRLGFQKPEI